jgi:hypothetical protein
MPDVEQAVDERDDGTVGEVEELFKDAVKEMRGGTLWTLGVGGGPLLFCRHGLVSPNSTRLEQSDRAYLLNLRQSANLLGLGRVVFLEGHAALACVLVWAGLFVFTP